MLSDFNNIHIQYFCHTEKYEVLQCRSSDFCFILYVPEYTKMNFVLIHLKKLGLPYNYCTHDMLGILCHGV